MPQTTEFIKFRLFQMPCCGHNLCWVNPRLPSYCPECAQSVGWILKDPEHTLIADDNARLILGVSDDISPGN